MPEQTNSKESEKKDNNDIAFRNESIKAINSLMQENRSLKQTIAEKAKSTRTSRQQAAQARAKQRQSDMKVRGLQGFTGQLGT